MSTNESISVQFGDIVWWHNDSNPEGEFFAIMQTEPLNGASLTREGVNPLKMGTLMSGRLAVMGHWRTDRMCSAVIEGFNHPVGALAQQKYEETILKQMRLEAEKGPIIYTPCD
jgi:hypothetical protein